MEAVGQSAARGAWRVSGIWRWRWWAAWLLLAVAVIVAASAPTVLRLSDSYNHDATGI